MPIINRAAEMQPEIAEWRRHLHRNPELLFDVHETAAFVADKLREFGCDEVVTGIGRTGVVGIIKGSAQGGGSTIGLRADMDALPITEKSGVEWASEVPGKMHACGHDGHTAMLLGASKYLAETRNFSGKVAVIFQPAEEGGGGGNVMVKEGMMERFGIEKVFGMHNIPQVPVGVFAIRPGPIMAATAEYKVTVHGKGGHAAMPHRTADPIVAASAMVTGLQSIVSRNANPIDSMVISVTQFHAGETYNVIPDQAVIAGTVRWLKNEIGELAEKRMREMLESMASAYGVTTDFEFDANYPVTFNHDEETEFATGVAREVAGEKAVVTGIDPTMGGEDFSYMLNARPGAFIFLGNGDTPGLHHSAYDFNDEIIPSGVSYWVKLVETALPR
jgi:hippurate hydrolase